MRIHHRIRIPRSSHLTRRRRVRIRIHRPLQIRQDLRVRLHAGTGDDLRPNQHGRHGRGAQRLARALERRDHDVDVGWAREEVEIDEGRIAHVGG